MISPQTCPICSKELPPETGAESPWFPFCTERCKQVDLLRWTEGRYSVTDPLTADQLAEAMDEDASEDGD